MGQQQTKTQKTQQFYSSNHPSPDTRLAKPRRNQNRARETVQCQGLLQMRTTPFKNSRQIELQDRLMFLENAETNLKMLLEDRLHTDKLFILEDVEKLIESVTFTLAYLQEKGFPYRDIAPQNIFYYNGAFKLLPNQLIEQSTFQKLKNGQECYPSPQLLIGLKLEEQDIDDEDILQKCNVFTFGMVMLEVATLLPSAQCYDLEGYQIYHQVLKERIMTINGYYGQKVARIIANMVDYDYQQRMTLKQLSIWVNREFQSKPQEGDELTTSMMVSKVTQKPTNNFEMRHNNSQMVSQSRKLSKNNSVYMKRQVEVESSIKEERNKIYIAEDKPHHEQTITNHVVYSNNYHPSRNDFQHQRNMRSNEKWLNYQEKVQQSHSQKINPYSYPKKHVQTREQQKINPYCQGYQFPREQYLQKQNMKKIAKEPVNPYRHFYHENQQDSRQSEPKMASRDLRALRQVSNQYYPKIEDMLGRKEQEQEKREGQSHTISWIKEEIMRSRGILQEFRKAGRTVGE